MLTKLRKNIWFQVVSDSSGSGFIAEEGTIAYNNEEYNWIIDPIDGTTNFIHGAPPYSISIGLRKGETLIGGVIYELSADECFYAFDGGKAFLNGKEIQVSSTDKVANSLIATGFPYTEFGLKKEFYGNAGLLLLPLTRCKKVGICSCRFSICCLWSLRCFL
jgi:fructose-1,6-bisphosphatase/inositol monophosphatase family enzyme